MLALACMVAAKAANVGVPLLLKQLVDSLSIAPGDPRAVLVVPAGLLLAYGALRLSTYPKLLFAGDPGALIGPQAAREFAAGLKNCSFINLGPGAHYLQEDHADAIGSAIAGWLPEVVLANRMSELA